MTELMLACKLNNHEGVETLLSKGTSINQKDFVRIYQLKASIVH